MHGDGNLPDRPRWPMFANRAAAEPQTARPATRRAIGSQRFPPGCEWTVSVALHSPAFLLGLRLGCADPERNYRSLAPGSRSGACGRVRTPAASLAFLCYVGGRVRPTLRPAVGLPSTPETGPDGAPPARSGLRPRAPLTRGSTCAGGFPAGGRPRTPNNHAPRGQGRRNCRHSSTIRPPAAATTRTVKPAPTRGSPLVFELVGTALTHWVSLPDPEGGCKRGMSADG